MPEENTQQQQEPNTPEEEQPTNTEPELETEEAQEYESFSEEMETQESPASPEKESSAPNADQQHIQALEEQLDRMKDQMVRALAEAENTRKRSIKERQDATKFAVTGFARDILTVADNLRRALESVPEEEAKELSEHFKNLTAGIEATERELLRVLEKNGISKIEPLDAKFDPNFHEVMFEAPMPDKENGTIIQVIEPGYMLNGRILRPARVGIAKNADAPPPPEGTGSGYNVDTEA